MNALIFDMDGVLVDSEPMWRVAEREIFAAVGLELTDADCEMTMGTRSDEVIAYWFQRSPWSGPSPAEVEERLECRMSALLRERAVAMPGVSQAVAMARRLGLRIALASSSSPRLIADVLAKLELEEAFEVARSAIDEPRGKPHPGVFLSTARELGVEPAECIVIEDSIAGVEAGRKAGMRVIAVPPAHFFDRPEYKVADFKISSLCELTDEMLR